MAPMCLYDGPDHAKHTLLLAHGAGAPMDAKPLTEMARALAATGFRVARFEFGYMAGRRDDGRKSPPPLARKLNAEYVTAVDSLAARGALIIGGKSMGGRVASMVADELGEEKKILGLLCLGYPFHPPGKPEQLRTKHLGDLKTPTLIVQGTRDPFGSREEVAAYVLSPNIEIYWVEDGDHDLKSRKRVTGLSPNDQLAAIARKVSDWANRLEADTSRSSF